MSASRDQLKGCPFLVFIIIHRRGFFVHRSKKKTGTLEDLPGISADFPNFCSACPCCPLPRSLPGAGWPCSRVRRFPYFSPRRPCAARKRVLSSRLPPPFQMPAVPPPGPKPQFPALAVPHSSPKPQQADSPALSRTLSLSGPGFPRASRAGPTPRPGCGETGCLSPRPG